MEYLAIYDQLNQPLHQNLPRWEVHVLGHWHRTSQIYVLHPQKGYLCHRRSAGKDLFPSLWDVSIGGHLSPGETYESCALRELSEELGISVHPDELELVTVTSVDGQDEKAKLLDREHVGIFLYKTNLPEASFKVQQEEIPEIEYLALPQLRADLQSAAPTRAYIPMQEHFLEILDLLEQHQKRNSDGLN
ncbi:NUDIX hydrolase [Rufibacter aurantiacus]|uniref:NUDIX hydrolase n=1 Tax=Rufibacter aurantiacus TaxID=2817374 RepID=UPI001B302A91|nr:NUDIX domain-containing protein [Rufibacter aurantiacus]